LVEQLEDFVGKNYLLKVKDKEYKRKDFAFRREENKVTGFELNMLIGR
jgi:hypothetical protein